MRLRESLNATLIAAQEIGPFPEEMTDTVLLMFKQWGKSLRSNETIAISEKNVSNAKLDSVIRKEIASRTSVAAPPAIAATRITPAQSVVDMFDRIRQSSPAPDGYSPPPPDLAKI